MNVIEELRWRGLIQDIMPRTEEYLKTNSISAYVGFDPTSDSLHIGNLVPIMLLYYLQKHGHKPFALVGGATGMIGDPSGKSKERQFLSEERLRHNESCIQAQLSKFLVFEGIENAAEIVNNYDWFKEMNFLTFLREVGKYLTINYMKAKDSVKNRIESEQGISYTEFTYQLVQGYDFYHLYKEKGVRLQAGGADQWGNITTGTELIRKKEGGSEDAENVFAFTAPLLTRKDGTKFGKTAEGENIWLDAKKTSPFQFYQYWIQSLADEDAIRCLKIFSPRNIEELQAIIEEHQNAPHLRAAHKALAADVTTTVHGKAELEKAIALTEFLYGNKISAEMLETMSAEDWQEILVNMSDSDKKVVAAADFADGISLVDLLVNTGIAESKTVARRAIKDEKSISVNGEKVTNIEETLTLANAFHQTYLFVQKGKKSKFVVVIEGK
ncbi:MAG: tyrosine--tRNA ligase [Bacteroidia bacterium]